MKNGDGNIIGDIIQSPYRGSLSNTEGHDIHQVENVDDDSFKMTYNNDDDDGLSVANGASSVLIGGPAHHPGRA